LSATSDPVPTAGGENTPVIVAGALLVIAWAVNLAGVLPDVAAIVASLAIVIAALVFGMRVGWLEKKLSSRIVKLGVPVVLAMVSQTAVNIVDTIFVGLLPDDVALPGVAAVGLTLPVFWLVGGFLSAIAVGTQAITARREGQRDDEAAGRTLMSAAGMALVLGLIFSIIGYYVLPSFLPLLNPNSKVMDQAIPFARIRYIGISSMVITAALKAFFDGTGRTHVHMVAAIVMNIINIILCYGLILGGFGMPRLEVLGAAWASTISSAVGTVVMIAWTFRPELVKRYQLFRRGSFSWGTASQIVRLSLPSGAATIIGMSGFLVFHAAVGHLDAHEPSGLPVNAAATTVIQQIVMVIFLISFAFGTATATLVSQSLGANDPNLAAHYAWESVKLGTLLMAAISSLIFIFPEEMLAVFIKSRHLGETGKALAIGVGVTPLRLIAGASTLIAAAVVFTQSLYGAGNTKFVMTVEGILHITCLMPLSWLLGVFLDGKLVGVWSAAALYVVLLATIMGWKFAEGSWKNIRL
jgi:multidrug resistance protein, MATE family